MRRYCLVFGVNYPERFQLRDSKHFSLTHEPNSFTRRARIWSLAYHIPMATLIVTEGAHPVVGQSLELARSLDFYIF